MEYNLVATTTFGLEGITAKELKALGYEDLTVENGKVHFEGDEMDIAIANVHLRTADRIFIKMAEFEARSFEELFQGTKAVKWRSKREPSRPIASQAASLTNSSSPIS